MEKKKSRWLPIFLWVIFLAAIAVIVYLSFQNGEDAKDFCKGFIQQAAQKYYAKDDVSIEELNQMAYLIRQSGRVLAFLVIGILGTITIHVSFCRWNWLGKTIMAGTILLAIAFLTEKLKIYIPTRHYSQEEMTLSVMAAMTGFLVVSVITLMISAVRGVVRLIATATHG